MTFWWSLSRYANYMFGRREQIFDLTVQHVSLVGLSMLLAVVIAVPLGVYLTRKRRFAEPVINTVGMFQTIPSLVLLVAMIPLFGIGWKPAVAALFLYSLLPLLRNTYTGILSVDRSVIKAARGMGLTNWQILTHIELPLALPVMMAGIRVAAVINVGTTVIASYIGAGGLGQLIFAGMQTMNNRLIVSGALPAALLAVVTDFLLRKAEQKLNPRRKKASRGEPSKANTTKGVDLG